MGVHQEGTPPVNNRIFKYSLPKQAAFTIGMPIGSRILKLNVQQSDTVPGATPFPLWDVLVVDKRDSDEEQHLQFTAADANIARAHFEDLGYVVNSVTLISGQAQAPAGASLVPTIWALVPMVRSQDGSDQDADGIIVPAPRIDVRFLSIPTGAGLPDGNWVYVGTLQLPATRCAEAVFHVFVDGTYVTVA